MTTKIYASLYEFRKQSDGKTNGVSAEFAILNPDYEKQNLKNENSWNCSRCSGCSGCSRCSDCSDCSRCSGCSRCSRCSGCSGCSRCSGCSGCSDCSGLRNAKPVAQEEGKSWFDVPVIPNIHRTILAAASQPKALNMDTWHTCETTHCRAGWAVHLAGEKGRALEKASSTLFAAMQIYRASSAITVNPPRFFGSNTLALADMERCAKEEAAANG